MDEVGLKKSRAGFRELLANWLPALMMMGLIFWTSSQSVLPGPSDKGYDFVFKKFAHLCVYSAIALSYLRGVHAARRPFLLAFLLTVLWAISDEYHQSMTPLREPTFRDVLIDATGGGAMLWLARRAIFSGRGAVRAAARAATGIGG